MGAIAKRKKFDRQFKIDTVNLVVQGDRSVKDVAASLGIAPAVLYRWIRAFHRNPDDAFPGKGRLGSQEEEIRRLRRELEQAKEDREILKKSPGILLEKREVRYRFVETHQDRWNIGRMCTLLNVTRSGFYAWRTRGPSHRAMINKGLAWEIRQIHAEGRGEYGSPTIHKILQERGLQVNRKRVVRLMREDGLRATIRRRWKQTTQPCKDHEATPNLLQQEFHTTGPNRVWLSDITFIESTRGWLYLTTIEDMWSRRIVGYAVTDHMRADAVLEALQMALRRREIAPGMIFHSDRGKQYVDRRVRAILAEHGMRQSMSSTGNCYDNAMAESFFATLKKGHALSRTFETLEEARRTLFDYIEVFYNRVRRHSSLGYKSPVAFEHLYTNLA